MLNPPTVPGIPGDDTILGLSDGLVDVAAGLPAGVPPVPGMPAAWLALNACQMQSHQTVPEGEPLVIQVVGVVDCSNWTGSVLLLDWCSSVRAPVIKPLQTA